MRSRAGFEFTCSSLEAVKAPAVCLVFVLYASEPPRHHPAHKILKNNYFVREAAGIFRLIVKFCYALLKGEIPPSSAGKRSPLLLTGR